MEKNRQAQLRLVRSTPASFPHWAEGGDDPGDQNQNREHCQEQPSDHLSGLSHFPNEHSGDLYERSSALSGSHSGQDNPSLNHFIASPVNRMEHHLTQVVLSSESSHHALQDLCRVIGEAFQADCCLITLHSRDRIEPHDAFWYLCDPLPSTQLQQLTQLVNHPAIEPFHTLTEPFTIPDLYASTQSAAAKTKSKKKSAWPPPETCPPFRSMLATRTQLHGRGNGMISVMRSQPYEWKESDVQLLKTLSPQVAIAISQVQLEQQVQKQIQYQSLIDQLTVAIRDGWEIDDIFHLAIDGSVAALQASRGTLMLLKYTNPLHKSRPADRIPEARATVVVECPKACDLDRVTRLPADTRQPETVTGTWLNYAFWASDCRLCQPILSGQAEAIVIPVSKANTIGLHDLNASEMSPLFDFKAMPSLVLMPLENQGTILGCISLQHTQHRLWSPEELSFVKLVAAQLSTAMIQRRTLQQVQSVVNERTAQLQRSLEVQAKLYEKTRKQVDQLRRLNEERELFLSTVSHELLTPLTSMRLAIRMLRQAELTPDRSARYLDILEEQCTQETKLINDMLALRKLEANPAAAQFHKLDIKYLIRDIVEAIEESWAEKGLGLVTDLPTKPLIIYTDPDSLNRILTELLSNAKKYSDPNSTIALKVAHDTSTDIGQLVLTLRNVGFGIQPDEIEHIFDKFRRGQRATKQAIQGTGLGLALVKRLVEHLNGSIAVSSDPIADSPAWETCFTITLPQHPDGVVRSL